MQVSCKSCKNPFEVDAAFLDFLGRVSPEFGGSKELIPAPTLCPDCRRQRRLAWRNESTLYKRTCDLSKRAIISIYPPDAPFTVYGQQEWWGDQWEGTTHGRNFDFTRSFGKQYEELRRAVPRMALMQHQNENSEYTNYVANLRNCYMLFSSDFNQDCQYGVWNEHSKNCTDNYLIDGCELCYESTFCQKNYRCVEAVLSSNCSDCSFIFDCKGCRNCFLCSNLRQKEHCILNVQYSKEDYEAKMQEFPLDSAGNYAGARLRFAEVTREAKHPRAWISGHVQNCTGDVLADSADCRDCFDALSSKDCHDVMGAFELKDMRDGCYVGGELGYEICECVPMPQHSAFTVNSYTGANLYYCDQCMNDCQDCFGCIGLKKKRHCILNKQYTKEEYEALVPRIIDHMRKSGEWGEFFPIALSPFAYNETQAQEYFPLTKEEVIAKGWRWYDGGAEGDAAIPTLRTIPNKISEVQDSITKEILSCSCGKSYRVIAQELKFLRDSGLPIPRQCPACRRSRRRQLRNPMCVWKRPCAGCAKEIETTYAPQRPEKVFCEDCYLKEVY